MNNYEQGILRLNIFRLLSLLVEDYVDYRCIDEATASCYQTADDIIALLKEKGVIT